MCHETNTAIKVVHSYLMGCHSLTTKGKLFKAKTCHVVLLDDPIHSRKDNLYIWVYVSYKDRIILTSVESIFNMDVRNETTSLFPVIVKCCFCHCANVQKNLLIGEGISSIIECVFCKSEFVSWLWNSSLNLNSNSGGIRRALFF